MLFFCYCTTTIAIGCLPLPTTHCNEVIATNAIKNQLTAREAARLESALSFSIGKYEFFFVDHVFVNPYCELRKERYNRFHLMCGARSRMNGNSIRDVS
mmetsp:Transcript_8630/g.21056  ORF Transcript_8630/g.21056 Transcript_8630/m.21056 type:complete len:99 (-) Transcript_8630:228-524(-)